MIKDVMCFLVFVQIDVEAVLDVMPRPALKRRQKS